MSAVKLKSRFMKTKNACVYENKKGDRIHTYGLLKRAAGDIFRPSPILLSKFLKLTGGNRRRSLMAVMEATNEE